MKYVIGERFTLSGVECSVAHIDARGYAYLVPDEDGLFYNKEKTYVGCVFAIVNTLGYDKIGSRIVFECECGAV